MVKMRVILFMMCLLTIVTTSCIHREYLRSENIVLQSNHDSLLIEVGIKNNKPYFIIRNERTQDYLMIDTSMIRLTADNNKLLIYSSDEAHSFKPNPVIIKCDSFFYYEASLPSKRVSKIELQLLIAVANGKSAFYYDENANIIGFNYRRIERVTLSQFNDR